jgi:hypothetical protein
VSGTGIVAEGVLLSDGRCVLHWLLEVDAINIYRSDEDLIAIHGHGGKTVILWCQDDDAYDATLHGCEG